jgi:xanthine/uracil permease
MADATDAVMGTVVPLIGLGIVAGMANRMVGNNNQRRARPVKKKKYHKRSVHWY